MHDPMVVAFTIRRPWPARRSSTSGWRWWPPIITVWHVEPDGRDALTVCRPRSAWRWHVHHWRIQVHLIGDLHRFLFERCELCGRRFPWGYAPVAHQWDQPRGPWFKVTKRAYHYECSGLVNLQNVKAQDERIIRDLVGLLAEQSGKNPLETVDWLTGLDWDVWDFDLKYRLTGLLGYERDDQYRLRPAKPREGESER